MCPSGDLVVIKERPVLLTSYSGTFRLRHARITINPEEAHTISREMASLFPDVSKMTLRIWRLEGMLASFDKDLIATVSEKKQQTGEGTAPTGPKGRAARSPDDEPTKVTARQRKRKVGVPETRSDR
jgi:hypothetical protein